jgi:hypothetical protein
MPAWRENSERDLRDLVAFIKQQPEHTRTNRHSMLRLAAKRSLYSSNTTRRVTANKAMGGDLPQET